MRFANLTIVNNNEYPEAFVKGFNSRINATFEEQNYALFQSIVLQGLRRVDLSAYFKRDPTEQSQVYQNYVDVIGGRMDEDGNEGNLVFLWNTEDVTMLARNNIEELNLMNPNSNFDVLSEMKRKICELADGEDGLEALRKMYEGVQANEILEKLEQEDDFRQAVHKHQEVYNQRWKYAKRCMKLVNIRSVESKSRKFANVVLSEEGVARGAAELMMAGMAQHVPLENVYTPNCELGEYEAMREVCEQLRQRFGKNCIFVNITSSRKRGQYPTYRWLIRSHQSMKMLFRAQRDHLLK